MSSTLEHKVYAASHIVLLACFLGMVGFGLYVHYQVITDDTPLCAPPIKEASK